MQDDRHDLGQPAMHNMKIIILKCFCYRWDKFKLNNNDSKYEKEPRPLAIMLLWLSHVEYERISRSTDAHSSNPLTQTAVAACVSSASGTVHLMSSLSGHGQSAGLLTQDKVSGQRYWEHETKTTVSLW